MSGGCNLPLSTIGTKGKRMGRLTIASASMLAVLLAAGCRGDTQPASDVWAVVNGQEIRRAEVEKYYANNVSAQGQLQPGVPGQPQPAAQGEPQSQEEALILMLNILEELIKNAIVMQRAERLSLLATDGEVEDKFTEVRSPYTEEEFQRQLKDRGLSVNDLKQDIRRQLSVQKLINREVVAKISITDQDVNDFYDQYRSQFNVAETQYRIAQIVITPRRDPQLRNRKNDDATTDLEARRKAATLEQQLNDGADFNQLAMDYSEDPATVASGGDLGYIPESALNQSNPVLRRAVLALRPAEVSDTIRLPDGYRILKLMAKQAQGQRNLSDPQVQQTIRDTLRNRKEQLLRAAFLATARDQSEVVNNLAQQVQESSGKLPEIVTTGAPAASQASPQP